MLCRSTPRSRQSRRGRAARVGHRNLSRRSLHPHLASPSRRLPPGLRISQAGPQALSEIRATIGMDAPTPLTSRSPQNAQSIFAGTSEAGIRSIHRLRPRLMLKCFKPRLAQPRLAFAAIEDVHGHFCVAIGQVAHELVELFLVLRLGQRDGYACFSVAIRRFFFQHLLVGRRRVIKPLRFHQLLRISPPYCRRNVFAARNLLFQIGQRSFTAIGASSPRADIDRPNRNHYHQNTNRRQPPMSHHHDVYYPLDNSKLQPDSAAQKEQASSTSFAKRNDVNHSCAFQTYRFRARIALYRPSIFNTMKTTIARPRPPPNSQTKKAQPAAAMGRTVASSNIKPP